ncbi:MAG: hypothetical protein K2X27_08145 [Candidatus Obscuribacterales bacterium]|nr:hypothetical protein [Candidatus Obscuribacterales bacterium]
MEANRINRKLLKTSSLISLAALLLLCLTCREAMSNQNTQPKRSSQKDCGDNIFVMRPAQKSSAAKDNSKPEQALETDKIKIAKSHLCKQSWELNHKQWIYCFYKNGEFFGFSPQNGRNNKGRWEIVHVNNESPHPGKERLGLSLNNGTTIWALEIGKDNQISLELCHPIPLVEAKTYLSVNSEKLNAVQEKMQVLISNTWKLASSNSDKHRPATLEFHRNHSATLIDSNSDAHCGYWDIESDLITLYADKPFGLPDEGKRDGRISSTLSFASNGSLNYKQGELVYVPDAASPKKLTLIQSQNK